MDELNKTAATEPKTRPEAAKLQDAPRRRVGSLTLGACLIAAGIFFLCYYFVPGFDWQLVVRIAPAAALVLLGCEVLFFAARPGRWKYDFVSAAAVFPPGEQKHDHAQHGGQQDDGNNSVHGKPPE